MDSLGSEQIEILESPSTVRISPAVIIERRRNRGSSEGPTAITTVTQIVLTYIKVED